MLALAAMGAAGVRGQGTAFTYQGLVSAENQLVTGPSDLKFAIYDSSNGGNLIAGPLTNAATEMIRGRFTVTLDFGTNAFTGGPCWLEIGVRTNSSTDFTLLEPRQQLTASPYAILANDVANPNVARLSVPGTNTFSGVNWFANSGNTFVGNFAGSGLGLTNVPLPLLNTLALSPVPWGDAPTNGLVWSWNSPNLGGVMGHVVAYGSWGGIDTNPPTGSETLLLSCRNIRIEPGWYQASGGAYLSIGNEDIYGDVFVNYTHPFPREVAANTRGVSIPLGFRAYGYDSAANIYFCNPGIQSHAVAVTNIGVDRPLVGPGGDQYTTGELWFYTLAPKGPGLDANTNYDLYPSIMVGRMRTDGWELRGKFIQERDTGGALGAGVALDFSKGFCYDLQAYATNLTFFTTNRDEGATNYERRVFLIRSGLLPLSITYPQWNASISLPLPANVGPAQILRLELESTGPGETNVNVISSAVLTDQSFSLDPSAAGFFKRASIGDPATRMAVNNLVRNGKAHGWWGKMDAVYPLVGATAFSQAQNLVSSNYAITWHGTVQHTANGVTGDGVSGYGDTGLNPAAGNCNFSQNSAHLYAYLGTQPSGLWQNVIGASDEVCGAFLAMNNYGWQGGGMNNADDGILTVEVTSDLRGDVMITRTDLDTEAIYCGATASGADRPSTGAPNQNIFLLARGDGGYATALTDANVRGASIGSGMTAAEWQTYASDWDAFEFALGRSAP